jgi:hypothetical protein
LTFWQISRPTGEERQPLLEAPKDAVERERLDARRGELERERKTVETLADFRYGPVCVEIRLNGPRARQKEGDALVACKGRDRVLLLAAQVQSLTARHEHAEPRTRHQHVRETRRRGDHVLEVVEEQQEALVTDVVGEVALGAERLCGGREHELGVAERSERHPPDASGVVVGGRPRCLERKPRLAAATGSSEGDEARAQVGDQPGDVRQLTGAAEEGRRRNRQVRVVETPQRPEFAVAELVDPLWGR